MGSVLLTGTNAIVTSDMLSGLTSTITDNLAVVLPVGLGIFAIFIGINIVPKIIKKFAK